MDNPFAVLTAIVAPCILTNACSVLALGTSNRVARVVDRGRTLTAELTRLGASDPEHASRVMQIERLRTRARLLMGALSMMYAALGSFAACALLSVLGALSTSYNATLVFHTTAFVALVVGLGGVGSLILGCFRMVAETRVALSGMAEEFAEKLGERPI